ncbi:hypothetical protein ABL78_8371 [Leptomonas seymouri]|uniref:Uncharacterized protein n=1 Tax=Leptomonas seymouri TaxID=5684 RepID=A0A0N0P272_LEPSE|nr:hypothetical protein ABL78_8371 [Leptomonas seymouri]|eukprot:KPI82619.1 hypothetical protein ABL78_8371 [Leptomonas seymouri]
MCWSFRDLRNPSGIGEWPRLRNVDSGVLWHLLLSVLFDAMQGVPFLDLMESLFSGFRCALRLSNSSFPSPLCLAVPGWRLRADFFVRRSPHWPVVVVVDERRRNTNTELSACSSSVLCGKERPFAWCETCTATSENVFLLIFLLVLIAKHAYNSAATSCSQISARIRERHPALSIGSKKKGIPLYR